MPLEKLFNQFTQRVSDKPEGCYPRLASPEVYVPGKTPNGEWVQAMLDNTINLPDHTELLQVLDRWVASNCVVHPEVGKTALCPTGKPYVSHVLMAQVTRELMEDWANLCIDVPKRIKSYLSLCVAKEIMEQAKEHVGEVLYWRRHIEVGQESEWDTEIATYKVTGRWVFDRKVE